LLRSGDTWDILDLHQDTQFPVAPSEGPATWLDDTRVVWGEGKVVHVGNADQSEAIHVFGRRISGLLGPLGADRVAVSTGGGEPIGPDLHLLEVTSRDLLLVRQLEVDLVHDAARWDCGLACIGTGIQASEVRFVWFDGRWRTHTAHNRALRAVVERDDGVLVTVDRSGTVLFWRGDPPRPFGSEECPHLAPQLATPPCQVVVLRDPTRVLVLKLAIGPLPTVMATEVSATPTLSPGAGMIVCEPVGGALHMVPSIIGLPLRTGRARWAPFLHQSGWWVFDLNTLEPPPQWKILPISTELDALSEHPSLEAVGLDAIRYWRNQLTSSAVLPEFPEVLRGCSRFLLQPDDGPL